MANITTAFPYTLLELQELVVAQKKIIIKGAGTSTVLPFAQIEKYLNKNDQLFLVSIDNLSKEICLVDEQTLKISGAITWLEARQFLFEKKYDLPLWPTETSAYILSGLATSASGERCFKYGPLRNYINKIKVINENGKLCEYHANKKYAGPKLDLSSNKISYFKNSLIPQIESEIDPFIGSEGQLGILIECQIKLVPKIKTLPFFVLLKPWDENDNYKTHIKVLNWVRNQKDIITCEMMDYLSLEFVSSSRFKNKKKDLIFFECEDSAIQTLCEELLENCSELEAQDIGQIELSELNSLRLEIPRKVADFISNNKLLKKGTDVQVNQNNVEDLFLSYIRMGKMLKQSNLRFLLFGHFGDCHLHFNILPTKEQSDWCDKILENFYDQIMKVDCMPFAEHGIGILKQKYWFKYVSKNEQKEIKRLKEWYDSKYIFNPLGYMSKIEI